MDHGSYTHPDLEETSGAMHLVMNADNLKDCRGFYGNQSSLVINTWAFNVNCTKGQKPQLYKDLLPAIEAHEGYGTPGMGPDDNGHQAQREIAAADPVNDPYAEAEPYVAMSSAQINGGLGTDVHNIDVAISAKAGDHNVVKENWGKQNLGYRETIRVYFTQDNPANVYNGWTIGGI